MDQKLSKPQSRLSSSSLRPKTEAEKTSNKKPKTTFSDIFKQTPEKILARKEERLKSLKKASFADIIKSPSTTTEVSKPMDEGQRRTSESRGMRRIEETNRVERIADQPPRGMRRIDETSKNTGAEDFGQKEEEAQRRWEEEQERRWALEEKKWEEEDERRRLVEERRWEEEKRREERMWEEQEKRRWEQDQERRNRRRVDVEKPQVDEVNRRPLTQVNRRRLDIQQQPALEEVRLVHRPITARSIGDSLERADHHPGKYQRVKPDQTQNPGAFGPPADQRSIEAAVAAGAAAYHAVSAIFSSSLHLQRQSSINWYFQDGHEQPKRLSFQIHGQEGPNSYRFGYDTGLG